MPEDPAKDPPTRYRNLQRALVRRDILFKPPEDERTNRFTLLLFESIPALTERRVIDCDGERREFFRVQYTCDVIFTDFGEKRKF